MHHLFLTINRHDPNGIDFAHFLESNVTSHQMQSYDGYFLCLSVWRLAAIGIEPKFAPPKSAEVVEILLPVASLEILLLMTSSMLYIKRD